MSRAHCGFGSLIVAFLAARAPAQEDPPLPLPEDFPPGAHIATEDDDLAVLISRAAADARRGQVREEQAGDALKVELVAAPDAFLQDACDGFLAAYRSGSRGAELIRKLKAVLAAKKGGKDKVSFTVTLHSSRSCFLQGDIRRHIAVSPGSVRYTVTEARPAPRFQSWKVIVGSTDWKKIDLAQISRKTVTFTIPRKSLPRKPLVVAIAGILSQDQSGDRHAGISTYARQISCEKWEDLVLPPLAFKIDPARLAAESSEAFAELLKKIEEGAPPAPGPGPAKSETTANSGR